jgi:hypothetical protein
MLAALVVAGASAAVAQEAAPAGPPPSWESLIPCAQKSDPAEGFRCFQQALRAAGYAPNPVAVAADKRRSFGLQLPKVHLGRREDAKPAAAPRAPAAAPEPERADEVAVTLEQVALTPPLNRLLLVTTEGAVWQQTDNDTVAPLPRPGQTMTVIKGSIDGFFCRFDKRTKVRCRRLH